ncbi:MAG TPA: polysaccharide deacetylase family protein [Fusibacter sp.]|nr:polysaccharide deacetylase family protein [Fusibacter sp.]
MKRQTAKLLIFLILLMTILTGFKAIKINTDQKSTIEDLNKGAIELERYKKELLDKSAEIDEQEAMIKELNQDILELTNAYETVKAQNEALTDKVVYLTFDDGPSSQSTAKIIEILKLYDVKATFFVQGRNVAKNAEALKMIHEAGHAIGNHSYSHNYTLIYSDEDSFWEDFEKCQEAIFSVVGIYPELYRFPGGSTAAVDLNGEPFVKGIQTTLLDKGMQHCDWNIDSGDAASGYASAGTIKSNAYSQIGKKKNAIVLMHDTDAKASTIEALPEVIEHYLAMGYRFDVLKPNGYVAQFRK